MVRKKVKGHGRMTWSELKMKDDLKSFFTKKNICLYIFFLAILFWQILRMGNNLGIYMDGIMSDYTLSYFLNPQKYSYSHFGSIGNIDLIGAFYHGNLTMFLTLLIQLITGTSSVLQYRMGNVIWAGLGILCLQYLFNRCRVNNVISTLIIVALELSPTYIITLMTNDYALLPGTFLTLLSLIFFLKWNENRADKYLYRCFGILGIAIYSYAIYMMYSVAFFILAVILLKEKNSINIFNTIYLWFAGTFLGTFFYILGFYSFTIADSSWLHISNDLRIVLFILIVLVMLALNYWINYLCFCEKKNYLLKIISFVVAVGVAVVSVAPEYLLSGSFQDTFNGRVLTNTNQYTHNKSIISIFERFVNEYLTLFDNSRAETWVLGKTSSRLGYLPLIVFGVVISLWLICNIKTRKSYESNEGYKSIFIVSFIYVFYFAIALLFVGMHFNKGHMMTSYVMTYLLIGLIGNDLLWREKFVCWFPNWRQLLYSLLGGVLVLNFVNCGLLANDITRTGGVGFFSNQTTELAKEALEQRSNGTNIMYVFPTWGFYTEFMYLTGNTVPFRQDINEFNMYLDNYIDEGFTKFVVAFFDSENADIYMNAFDEYQENVNTRYWYSKDGQLAFTTFELDIESPLNK